MINAKDELLSVSLANISDTINVMERLMELDEFYDRQQIAEFGRTLLQSLKKQIETLK